MSFTNLPVKLHIAFWSGFAIAVVWNFTLQTSQLTIPFVFIWSAIGFPIVCLDVYLKSAFRVKFPLPLVVSSVVLFVLSLSAAAIITMLVWGDLLLNGMLHKLH